MILISFTTYLKLISEEKLQNSDSNNVAIKISASQYKT